MQTPSLGGLLTGAEDAFIICRNDEASASIAKGDTVIFTMDGTRDGKDVVLPTTAGLKSHSLVAGVAEEAAAAGEKVRLKARGVVNTLNIMLMTRAATTDNWATYPAVALYDVFNIDTVGGYPRRSAAAAQTVHPAAIVALGTLASGATQASTTSNTSLVSTATIKAFVRIF
jgi:hypothetical protein